jgi:hypothetical protein
VSPRLLRAALRALVAVVVLIAASGTALYGWSAGMWETALTWPPLIGGGVAMTAAAVWIGRAAAAGLGAVRPTTPRPGSGRQSS